MQSASGIVAVSLRSFQEIYPLKLDLKSQTASQTGVTGNNRPFFAPKIRICTPQWSSAATCCPEIGTAGNPSAALFFTLLG